MKSYNKHITIIIVLLFGLAHVSFVSAHEFSGRVAVEGLGFFEDAQFPGQERDTISAAIQPEYYHEWENGSSLTFAPFGRLDSADSERSHVDVRELNYLWLGDTWELRVGAGKVFWGTTEFVHLVDIINQTDAVESSDGEEKLGQPMVHLSVPRDWGVIDLFVLPYFHERTFPGREGRLRSALNVDTNNARYESSAEEWHVDVAFRYSHSIGDWDIGISHFYGTGREPTIFQEVNEDEELTLIPYYELISQTGVDLQLVAGEWLLKFEALYRTGQGEDFLAATGGFEYTFMGIAGAGADLSVIGEWAYDARDNDATTPFQNDAIAGLRLALNDPAGSELLAGMIQDATSSTRAASLEASRRFGSNWKASLEARAFLDVSEDDPYYNSLRDDSFVRFELAYYF